MNRRTAIGLGIAAALAASGGIAAMRSYTGALAQARARVATGSKIVSGRFGPLEYATAGSGRPVLMIHGTGGGFDQGLSFGRRLIDAGYQVIAPSRFGYLRSAFPADTSAENQADAFIDLLDALGIERVAAIGGSAGALSAMQFAIRHPERCSALLPIVPAAYAPQRPPQSPLSPLAMAIMEYALQSDFLFWTGLVTAEQSMIATLLATDPTLVEQASAEERTRARAILWDILPVSARANGLLSDARQTLNPAPMAIETIRAPTLTISLEDDHFGTFAAARHIAASVPGARLLAYKTGGHVWVGHDREMMGEVDAFLKSLPEAL